MGRVCLPFVPLTARQPGRASLKDFPGRGERKNRQCKSPRGCGASWCPASDRPDSGGVPHASVGSPKNRWVDALSDWRATKPIWIVAEPLEARLPSTAQHCTWNSLAQDHPRWHTSKSPRHQEAGRAPVLMQEGGTLQPLSLPCGLTRLPLPRTSYLLR